MSFNNYNILMNGESTHNIQFKSVGKKVKDDILGFDDNRIFGFKKKNFYGELVDDIGGMDVPRAFRNPGKAATSAPVDDALSAEETTEPSETIGMDESLLQKDRPEIRKYLARRQRYNMARTMLASRRRRRSSDDDMTLGS
tara:strand:- start:349 stop:771 length:423 start_codon:yes stop_codon:yes gene_type:complete